MVQTLLEATNEYQRLREQEANNIRSLIKKRVLPELLPTLGLERLQQKSTEVVFDQIPIAGFVITARPIIHQQLLQVGNSGTRKVMKSQWKRFCDWLQTQAWYVAEPILTVSPSEEITPFTHLPRKSTQAKQSERKAVEWYGLKESEINSLLWEQIQAFDKFCQSISQYRLKANRDVTQDVYRRFIYLFLGWLKKTQNIDIKNLNLAQFTDIALLKAYEHWNRERGMSSRTIDSYLKPALPIAKFLFYRLFPTADSNQFEQEIKPLREFFSNVIDQKDRPHSSDEACRKRSLTTQQCETIVRYLEWRCKDLEAQQGQTCEVVDAWMDYLIIALLVTTGVRQREIRELCLERLVLEVSGMYSIALRPEEHKIGSITNKGRGYPLFVGPLRKQLCADLSYYLEFIRPKNLDHSCLFFIRRTMTHGEKVSLRGDCIKNATYLSFRIPNLIGRVTEHLFGDSRKTTCHDFRRITATWVCTYGEPKHFSLYAEMLGHSEQMLRELYAKIHPGALAAQVPFAYEEISADEARILGKTSESGTMTTEAKLEIALNMLNQVWGALPKAKREDFLEIYTSAQLQLLGIM